MKSGSIIHFALAGLIALCATAPTQAELEAESRNLFKSPGSKQTSKDFNPAPDRMETNFGTLEFGGGAFPTKESAQKDSRRDGPAARDPGLHGLLPGAVALWHRQGSQDTPTSDSIPRRAWA